MYHQEKSVLAYRLNRLFVDNFFPPPFGNDFFSTSCSALTEL